MNILPLQEKMIIIGNTLVAIGLIYAGMNLTIILNSHAYAVILALIIGAWLALVFKPENSNE